MRSLFLRVFISFWAAMALIAQVPRLSRLDAGTDHARREVVDLVALVRDVARDAQFESEAGGIEVTVDAVNAPLPVSGDPDLPPGAIENVVRNAADGGLEVVLELPLRGRDATCVGSARAWCGCRHGTTAAGGSVERLF